MKFLYEYRTRDNELKSSSVCASSRDAAFQLLRSQGIRAARVTEAPGFFNKLFGKCKRWIAIAILSGIAVVLTALLFSRSDDESAFAGTTRRQVIGDIAVIEKGVRTGWEDVFDGEGERFLASFAVPGVPAGLRNTSEAEIRAALDRRVGIREGDSIEARQIKSMVEGMKDELRRFLKKNGTVMEYGQRLVQRQEQEIGYYQRAKREIEEAKKNGMPDDDLLQLWEARNRQLRAIGVKLVAFPE